MTPKSSPAIRALEIFFHSLFLFKKETGQSLAFWAFIALLNFAVQIVFRRELAPGEFGTFNTTLGIIGLSIVPLPALSQAFTWFLAWNPAPDQARRLESLRDASFLITETFAWAWGLFCVPLLFIALPLTELPRYPLLLFTLLNVLVALGGLVSAAVCRKNHQMWRWGGLLTLARVAMGAGLAWTEPWAESALATFLVAGLITLVPLLRQPVAEMAERIKALRAALDPGFLLYFGATLSVTLGVFLFTSADRIVAQSWFGVATNNNMGYVDWPTFDAYQTAGLLARSILWGTQPLLLVLFAQRSRLNRTTLTSLTSFWIYLGALLFGVIFLILLHEPLSRLFCGKDYTTTSSLVPTFAMAMLPLGLLQGLGMFSLASRRYHECFVVGACGIGYALVLYFVGRQPQLMPAYMFGAGLVCLMIVFFVGVVRWGRKQP